MNSAIPPTPSGNEHRACWKLPRAAAFLAAGTMAFAYWLAHAPRDLFPVNNGGDAAILYCFVFLYLVFTGPGPWSLDAIRAKSSVSAT